MNKLLQQALDALLDYYFARTDTPDTQGFESITALRAAIAQPAHRDNTAKLLQIIASAYQIAGAYNAPVHVLDVLANPEMATQEQIDALLPFMPGVTPAGQPIPARRCVQ